MEKILLAVDGSQHSNRAADMAGALSGGLGLPVDIVHVVHNGAVATSASVQEYARIEKVVITQQELLESIGSRVVAEAGKRVVEQGGHVEETRVLIGSPAHEIVGYAETHDADMVVMGRRGLGDVAGLLMGSVSHKVGHLTDVTLVTTE
jgi:nucleotide-binding universal stress UspA family protein